MPGGKSRLPLRQVAGLWLSSGSISNRITELRAGSVSVTTPVFSGASNVGSSEGVSVAVTGLTASHMVVVTPGSMPGGCVMLRSACAIADAIETVWIHTASAAAAACAVTLNYIAYRDST